MDFRGFGGPRDVKVSVSDLISDLGAPHFDRNMAAFLDQFVDVVHLSLAQFDEDGHMLGFRASTTRCAKNAHLASEHFVSSVWPKRPQLYFEGNEVLLDAPNMRVSSRHADNIRDPEYKQECYNRIGISERIQFQRTVGNTSFVLSWFKNKQQRAREAFDISYHVSLADTVLSAWVKHLEITGDLRSNVEVVRFDTRGENPEWTPYRLSRRESQIAQLICLGMTTTGIGLELGISENTVLTYRKRIYAKIGISSQRELLAMRYRQS